MMVNKNLGGPIGVSSLEFEKRKFKRHLMKDHVFAALRDGFRKVGKIDDIGMKGLGFSYLKQTANTRSRDHDHRVDIFIPQNGFHLFNIQCRTIYEKGDVSFVEGAPAKLYRCGLHFGKLSDIQLNLLDFIISNFTVKNKLKEKMPILSV